MAIFLCTKDNPWTEEKAKKVNPDGQTAHADAIVIRDADDTAFSTGNRTTYRCPNCGLEFSVTEPDY